MLQIYVKGDIMYGALNFSILVEISSYPPVFFNFKDESVLMFLLESVPGLGVWCLEVKHYSS